VRAANQLIVAEINPQAISQSKALCSVNPRHSHDDEDYRTGAA
jgi:hypothetical protein